MTLLFTVLVVVILGAFAVTSIEFGVDSRDESDDPHCPKYPVSIA